MKKRDKTYQVGATRSEVVRSGTTNAGRGSGPGHREIGRETQRQTFTHPAALDGTLEREMIDIKRRSHIHKHKFALQSGVDGVFVLRRGGRSLRKKRGQQNLSFRGSKGGKVPGYWQKRAIKHDMNVYRRKTACIMMYKCWKRGRKERQRSITRRLGLGL